MDIYILRYGAQTPTSFTVPIMATVKEVMLLANIKNRLTYQGQAIFHDSLLADLGIGPECTIYETDIKIPVPFLEYVDHDFNMNQVFGQGFEFRLELNSGKDIIITLCTKCVREEYNKVLKAFKNKESYSRFSVNNIKNITIYRRVTTGFCALTGILCNAYCSRRPRYIDDEIHSNYSYTDYGP